MRAFFRALRHRPFALLWSGQTISRLGDSVYQLALAWWVLEKTGSPATSGLVLVFAFTPMLLFLLAGGVAVDRLPRVRIMLASDLARGLCVTGVAGLAYAGRLEVWHVLAASLIFGLVDAFFQPAYIAAVPDLTPVDLLPSANALTSLSGQAGRIVGPLAAASLVAVGGTPAAFAVNAASFFASALCLAPLLRAPGPAAGPAPEAPAQRSVRADLRAGFATVRAIPILWVTILVAALFNITLAGPYQIALPYLVDDRFAGQVQMLGWLYAAFAVGYVLGGVWYGRRTTFRWRGWTLYATIAAAGLGLLVIGLPVPPLVLLLAAALNGAALEIFGVIWTTSLQTMVPADQLGRVASIDALGSFGLLPVGLGLVGLAVEALGAPAILVLGGALTMGLAGLGLLHPQVRGLD